MSYHVNVKKKSYLAYIEFDNGGAVEVVKL